MFVDLPGYGYARVAREVRATWGPMIEEFLREEHQLKLTVVIIDVRREPTELDQMMIEWLQSCELDYQIVASKTDKLSGNRRRRALELLTQHFGVDSVLPFSARHGDGRRELWRRIKEAAEAS